MQNTLTRNSEKLQLYGQIINESELSKQDLEIVKAKNAIKVSELSDVKEYGKTGKTELEYFVNSLVMYLGVKTESKDHLFFIKEVVVPEFSKLFPHATASEVMMALRLGVQGRLLDEKGEILQMFRMIDIVSLSQLMRSYNDFANRRLGELNKQGKLYLQEPIEKHYKEEEVYEQAIKTAISYLEDGMQYIPIGIEDLILRNMAKDSRFEFVDYREYLEKGKEIAININQKVSNNYFSSRNLEQLLKALTPEEYDENKTISYEAKKIAINKMVLKYIKDGRTS